MPFCNLLIHGLQTCIENQAFNSLCMLMSNWSSYFLETNIDLEYVRSDFDQEMRVKMVELSKTAIAAESTPRSKLLAAIEQFYTDNT